MTTMVSAKVPDDLKDEADEYDVNKSAVFREALEAEVRRRRRKRLAERSRQWAEEHGDKIDMDEVVASIRHDREER